MTSTRRGRHPRGREGFPVLMPKVHGRQITPFGEVLQVLAERRGIELLDPF